MTDFHKALRQNVHEESADELKGGNSHHFPTVVILVIAPFECNLTVLDFEDTVIGDSDAMCIASEIFHNTGGGFEWRFAVDDPLFVITGVEKI